MTQRNIVKFSEIIEIVMDATGESKRTVRLISCALFDAISDILCLNECAKVDGFGMFVTYERPATTARNMHTGEPMIIGPHWAVRFSPSKVLKQKMRESEQQYKEQNA